MKTKPVYLHSIFDYKTLMDVKPTAHSSVLAAMRTRSSASDVMPWLLVFVLFSQALIPLQTHTQLRVNDQGFVVEVCTLNGLVSVPVDSDDPHSLPPDEGNQQSPAVAFSQLIAGVLVGTPVVQMAWVALQVTPTTPPLVSSPAFIPLRVRSIRAPPFTS